MQMPPCLETLWDLGSSRVLSVRNSWEYRDQPRAEIFSRISTIYIMLLVAILVIVLLSYVKFRMSRRRLYELANKIPGIKSYPLIGSGHIFLGNSQDIFDTYQRLDAHSQRNGGYCKFWMGPALYVVLTNPADVEILLNTCFEKGTTYKFANSWLGNGLIGGPVQIWKQHRKIIAPTFNQQILDNFVDIYWKQSKTLIEKLRDNVAGPKFNIINYMSACTLDIICETVMGVQVKAQSQQENPYFEATMNEMNILNSRMTKIWLHPEFIFKLTQYHKLQQKYIETLHAFTNNIIAKKRKEYTFKENNKFTNNNPNIYKPRNKFRKALLDYMMDTSENGEKLTDVQLREEVDTIMVAGSETTALTVSFALVMIGAHPEIQRKIMNELNEIFGDSKRSVTKADLVKMQYLERVIKETLRKYPVIPIVVRVTDRELELTSATIPTGTSCLVSIWGLSRNPSVWGEDAEQFEPDRFAPERCAQRHPCSFIPFSSGMRNCIGRQFAMMSMKVLLSTFLRNYSVEADPDIKLKIEITLRPVNELKLSIAAR